MTHSAPSPHPATHRGACQRDHVVHQAQCYLQSSRYLMVPRSNAQRPLPRNSVHGHPRVSHTRWRLFVSLSISVLSCLGLLGLVTTRISDYGSKEHSVALFLSLHRTQTGPGIIKSRLDCGICMLLSALHVFYTKQML
jgi:hypothetical protein